jgi:hypothetical protein
MTVPKIQPEKNDPIIQQPTQPAAGSSSGQPDFSKVLAGAHQVGSPRPVATRWSSLGFLATQAMPRITWPWLQPDFDRTIDRSLNIQPQPVTPVASADPLSSLEPMAINQYPRPVGDNGKGIHWIPTVQQSPAEIDQFVSEAVNMGMKWVVFLNDQTNIGDNDYLVNKLTSAGIEPIMRVYTPRSLAGSGRFKGDGSPL